MKSHPRHYYLQKREKKRCQWAGLALLLMLILLAACAPKTVTVEVTRVVTETVTVEGETVEVTRVVTETVVETIEAEPEETDEGPPSATGSEGDAGPLPPPPGDGPKVAEGRGSTPAAILAMETAVTLRATQTNGPTVPHEAITATAVAAIDPIELQKWCQLATKVYKKRC